MIAMSRVVFGFWVRLMSLMCGIGLTLVGTATHAQTMTCHGRTITALDFRSPTLVSGTALSAGAVYRFANVATGIDARVTIVALNGATLATIDNDAGLIGNFQPELAGANARSVDFTIRFVVAGTTTPISFDFASSGVDIDGDSGSIREYAEFSNSFAAYVLDASTNLDVNASGPSVASNVRFESRTNFTAPGIDETSTPNIVSVLYTSTSNFNYRIGTLGTGNTTRLTSLDFGCPALTLPSTTTVVPQDFGDAPASYGNPAHDIVTGFRMGATNTSEPARYNSPTATGDTGDDGATIVQLRQSQTTTATVTVAGTNGRLQCWIDFNGDGDFADAGEQVATNIRDNNTGDTNPATGTITFNITTPATATLTQTFIRFRWSSTTNLSSTATASNGEVEDYAVTIFGPAVLSVSKTSLTYATTGINKFSVPASDMIYTITTSNVGTGSADNNSIFMVDALPATVELFIGDFDGAGAATGTVLFTQSGAGLTFTPATDLRYSNLAAAPASFAACTYTPVAGYDPAVRYICFNPKGAMLSGGAPSPSFTMQFKARIK
jgi:GEVED domain